MVEFERRYNRQARMRMNEKVGSEAKLKKIHAVDLCGDTFSSENPLQPSYMRRGHE